MGATGTARKEKPTKSADQQGGGSQLVVERVQTGVRIEKRLLQVLKAIAEYHDISLGDLLEGIVLHAFEGKSPFGHDSLQRIEDLKRIYNLDLDASASHRLREGKVEKRRSLPAKSDPNGVNSRAVPRSARAR